MLLHFGSALCCLVFFCRLFFVCFACLRSHHELITKFAWKLFNTSASSGAILAHFFNFKSLIMCVFFSFFFFCLIVVFYFHHFISLRLNLLDGLLCHALLRTLFICLTFFFQFVVVIFYLARLKFKFFLVYFFVYRNFCTFIFSPFTLAHSPLAHECIQYIHICNI